MQNLREFSLVFVIINSLAFILAVPPPDRLNCAAQARCSFAPPLAWATDGQNCKVFYNPCHLRNFNCERQKNGIPILIDTTREKCTQNCLRPAYELPGCTKELNPVCTDRYGTLVTFLNHCLWKQEMCKTGEAYIFNFQGTCPAQMRK